MPCRIAVESPPGLLELRRGINKDRNAGRGHSVKTDNSSIERVEEFKYLGTTLTDQNSI